MRIFTRFPLILLLSLSCFVLSCDIDNETKENADRIERKGKSEKPQKPIVLTSESFPVVTDEPDLNIYPENLRNLFSIYALDEEECLPSELTPILLQHLAALVSDPLAEDYFNLYTNLSSQLAILDTSEQYFGENGEYTNLVNRRVRELERFWDMEGELRVNGEHNESLNNREKLATLFYRLIQDEATWEMAYEAADEILVLNTQSPNLPESLFFSLDGFLTFNKTIVIGDGLVQMISVTGLDPKLVYSAILAHEWAHQIQLDHFDSWYPGEEPGGPESPTHLLELEADYFAAYFLTHKRGATYNWKNVEEFLQLSFTLGDCATTSPLHHGTPAQRMRASRLGYELAASAQKKGHILNPEEVHQAFQNSMPQILQ